MNGNFSPAVITSRKAERDYADIQAKHREMMNNMQLQSQKVEMFNAQKAAELQAQNSMQAEIQKEKMVADTTAKKDALQFQQKQSEIDVKRAALSMKQ